MGILMEEQMATPPIALTARPESRLRIGQEFYGHRFDQFSVEKLRPYFEYHTEELELFHKAVSEEPFNPSNVAVQTYEDIFHVVNTLRENGDSHRAALRSLLSARFPSASQFGLDRSINLAIRLWLMVNLQGTEFGTGRVGVTPLMWDEHTTLRAFFHGAFPKSRWPVTAQSARLGPHFTAVFLQRVCGVKIEWTTSLHDHLRFDQRRRALKIFPYKCYLQQMMDGYQHSIDKKPLLIPFEVLSETQMSLDLLFPYWDKRTQRLLKKEKQTFHYLGPFFAAKSHTLADFDHWRERLLELNDVFQSPPASWAQMWRDCRNPQQFWTFRLAVVIFILTVISTVGSIVQAWASVRALKHI